MSYQKAYTARELAALKLKGWPTHVSNFISRAKKEGWPSSPNEGRGGGQKYPFATLPIELQKAIIFKLADDNDLHGMGNSYNALAPVADVARISGEDRRNAKLTIVALFDKFRASCGMAMMDAEETFIKLYATERANKIGGIVPAWLFDIYPEFSARSLHRWRSLAEKNVQKLGGSYGNRKGTSILQRAEDGEVANFIAAILVKETHFKAGHVRDACRARFGDTVTVTDKNTEQVTQVTLPQIRAFERFIAEWKVTHADIHLKMTNPDAYKNKRMLALGRADAHVHRLNQEWQIDASPADMLCSDGRYTIYAVIDVWSRRAMFSVSKTAKTEASLLLIRKAIMEWGVPETIKTDNGSDFVSKRFVGALINLGIGQPLCDAYSPEQKPFVERVIRTIQHDLMVILPGFVGHSVADRKQIEAKKTFAQKLGQGNAKTFQISMTHTQLQERMDQWTKFKYHMKPRKSLQGQTPFAKAASWTQPIRKIENLRALDLLLAPLAGGDGFRIITKEGLRIDNAQFYGPGIEINVGKRVMVRHDPENMGRVYVFSEDNEFICEAINIHRDGVHPAVAAGEAKARQKRFMDEETKDIKAQARGMTAGWAAEEILSLAARDASTVTAFPKQSESYTTDALDEAGRAFSKEPIPSERTEQQKAQQDAFVIKFNQRQESVKAPAESDEDRWWKRAKSFESCIDKGEPITDGDRNWLMTIAQPSTWYKSRKRFETLKASTETGV